MVFHADCNNFFASCECLDHPELKNVPMAVAGDPEKRAGIVVAKNDLAKRCGVKTTDTVYTALRKCPGIVFVPPRHRFYKQVSDRVNAIYLEYTPFVEPASIDESFLDIETEDPVGTADMLRARVRDEIGITISVGVSFCKFFAKMGSDYKKPDATTLITRENFRDILWPLPVSDMLFVGDSAAQALRRKYIQTIGDLAHTPKDVLRSILGKQGEMLWDRANGIDPSPVRRFGDRDAARSVSHGSTFPHDLTKPMELRAAVSSLSAEVAASLHCKGMHCSVAEVRIKRPDLSVISRQVKLAHRTDSAHDIRSAVLKLVFDNIAPGEPIRAITVGAAALIPANEPEQLSLFDDERERRKKLDNVLRDIQTRFGTTSVLQGIYPDPDISAAPRKNDL